MIVGRWPNCFPHSERFCYGSISLACEIKADGILIDDAHARRVALQAGFSVIGTVGILEFAANLGLLNLNEALQKLRLTNARIDPKLIADALQREALHLKQKKK